LSVTSAVVLCSRSISIPIRMARERFTPFTVKKTESARRVLVAITPVLRGVRNLSQTYRDDVDVFAKFTRLVRDVEDNLRKLSRQLPEAETQIHPDDSGIAPISPSPLSSHRSRTGSQAEEQERAECQ